MSALRDWIDLFTLQAFGRTPIAPWLEEESIKSPSWSKARQTY